MQDIIATILGLRTVRMYPRAPRWAAGSSHEATHTPPGICCEVATLGQRGRVFGVDSRVHGGVDPPFKEDAYTYDGNSHGWHSTTVNGLKKISIQRVDQIDA